MDPRPSLPPETHNPLRGFGGDFLRAGTGGPGDWGRRPWGALGIDVPAGDEAIRVEGLDPGWREALAARFGAGTPPSPPQITLRLWRAPASDFLPLPPPPWEFTFDCDYLPDRIRVAGAPFVAHVPMDARGADLWIGGETLHEFLGATENILRLLTAYRILARGGMMLHSCAPVRDGRAFACAAVSGTGKSTLGRLALAARDWNVLSDDLNALLPGDTGYRLQGLPYTGDLPRDRATPPVPLAALVLLEQAASDVLEPVPAAVAMSRLLRCAPYANADRHRQSRLMDNLARVASAVPAFRLGFTRGGAALELLANHLRGAA